MSEVRRYAPNQVTIGASWYPEMWPISEWERDADRMAELGFNLMRLFEFAWHRCEPHPGQYDFAWARRVMDLLHARGIQVMIGTPTAAPPAWLSTMHPEILGTGPDGKRQSHGKRKHYNHHSVVYREYCRQIVGKMVEALADHPALHSWQIDNEMSGYDYGPETRAAFHAWLERRFGSVEALNAAWGLEFWSQAYQSFDQVPLCVAEVGSRETPERHHPSLLLAIAEFQNEAWQSFIGNQSAVIRAAGEWPITTNKTGWVGGGMNWSPIFADLDCVGASIYADLSYYHNNVGRYDAMRGQKPGSPYMLLETAPNWSGGGPIWNIHHEPRGIEVMSWMSTLMGGCSTLFWQWRSHWAGQEMQHGTHVSQTGKWMPGKEAWQALASGYQQHGAWLMQHPPRQADIGIMVSTVSSWVFSIDPIHPSNRYEERLREDYHMPLVRRHYWRDLVPVEGDLSHYKVLILPHLPILPSATREGLRQWVEEGGRLLLGPLTGTRREDMTTWTDQEFGGLEELMGGASSVRFSPHWVEDTIEVLFDDDHRAQPRIWCEGFTCDGAEVRATYHGGWGHGHAAVLDHRYGQGRVITVGCPTDEDTYIKLVQELCADVGVGPVADGGDRVLVIPRDDQQGHTVAYAVINYGKSEDTVTLISDGIDLLSGESIDVECQMPPLSVRIVDIAS
ncbi:MAG: hypothetical protein EA401_12935 [Planctomycetota bacterium]|nr:MAG: hypothetical protein EA401_12935 [Planctomycetota bacterium]